LTLINRAYPAALILYGEYLTFIKNNPQEGKIIIENANNIKFSIAKSVDEIIKTSEILFTEDAVVVHISGNKESSGRILKVS
jgi:hypothetical protein